MHRAAPARAPPRVHHAHRRAHQAQARQAKAQAQVHILAIHEITLVEAAHPAPHRQGKHKARRIHPIDARLPAAEHAPAPQRQRRGQRAFTVLHPPIVIELQRVGRAHTRRARQPRQTDKRLGGQPHVRIEHADEGLIGTLQRPVVVGAKALRPGIAPHLQRKRPRRVGIDRVELARRIERQHHARDHARRAARQIGQQGPHGRAMSVAHHRHHQPSCSGRN